MEIAVVVLSVVAVVAVITVISLKKELKSISKQTEEILNNNTNALITVSTKDKSVINAVKVLNNSLKELRKKELNIQAKNAEISTAITNISHDLRTPLTAISGYLELLKAEEKSEEVERCLRIIENRTDAMKNLTEELFQYSIVICGENQLEFQNVSVNGVLEESIAVYYAVLKEKGIEPLITLTDRQIIRKLDKNALMRIFANILSNAVKYSDGDLEITLTDSGDAIFANTSSKLDEIQVGKIFDRFYTVENARTSTGLGLSIARSLAEKMNGNVTAEYNNGKFLITVSFNGENALA
ncbi:MAG: sensor histidine kinase [Acutalibacteraceae bacterium]